MTIYHELGEGVGKSLSLLPAPPPPTPAILGPISWSLGPARAEAGACGPCPVWKPLGSFCFLPQSPFPYQVSTPSFPLWAARCPHTSGHLLIIVLLSQATADPARPAQFCAFWRSPGPRPCLRAGHCLSQAGGAPESIAPTVCRHHPLVPAGFDQPSRVGANPTL